MSEATPVVHAPVSIVILTLNEALNIADCLASCAWSDDVHVLDSGSTDQTTQIARQLGAHVHVHPFTSFGDQRNWAIDHIPTRHSWIFHLDADERFTPELVAAMARLLDSNPSEAGYYVPEKFMFMERWLKRTGNYPKYQLRLFHKGRLRFRDYGHGQRESTHGRIGTLHEPYVHFPLSKGVDEWRERHNRYSSREAEQVVAGEAEQWSVLDLVSRDRVRRRRALKECSYRIPFRAFARWFTTLFLLGGIVEGRPALTYARLVATYDAMTARKVREVRAAKRNSANLRAPVARN